MNATEAYRCRVCKQLWETDIAAETCCEHVDELYQCSQCNQTYIVKDEAEKCCQ